MAWINVARENELGVGQMKRVAPADKPLLLVNAEGGLYCVDELCSHEDYSLWFGCVRGRSIKCSPHGSYFDLESGKPLNEPADCPLATHPVIVENGGVWTRWPEYARHAAKRMDWARHQPGCSMLSCSS